MHIKWNQRISWLLLARNQKDLRCCFLYDDSKITTHRYIPEKQPISAKVGNMSNFVTAACVRGSACCSVLPFLFYVSASPLGTKHAAYRAVYLEFRRPRNPTKIPVYLSFTASPLSFSLKMATADIDTVVEVSDQESVQNEKTEQKITVWNYFTRCYGCYGCYGCEK